MNILITGCTGFLGSTVIDHRVQKGHHLFCLSRTPSCPHAGKSNHVQHDLSEPLDTRRLPGDVDCIIHTAASMDKGLPNTKMFQINTVGPLELLEYGKKTGVQRFIFLSSGAVYGYSDHVFTERSRLNPIGFYGLSKYQAEMLVTSYRPWFASTFILRLFFPYGPGQTRGIIPRLMDSIRNKSPITIYNDGTPAINPIFVNDVVHAIERVMLSDGHHTVNLCGDEVTRIGEMSQFIGELLQVEPLFVYEKDKAISNLVGSNRLLKRTLGVRPMTPWRQGIPAML